VADLRLGAAPVGDAAQRAGEGGPSSVSMRRSLISTGTSDPSARRPSASTLVVTVGPSGSRGRSRSRSAPGRRAAAEQALARDAEQALGLRLAKTIVPTGR
jgi:hypothetical protein